MWPDPRGLVPPSAQRLTWPSGVPPDVVALCRLTPEDWQRTLLDLLPRGVVWPRDPETVLARFWLAIADEMVAVQGRDCDLLAESYPCGATELLPEWEATVGLPNECIPDVTSLPIAMQRQYVCAALAAQGGQSASYYMALAAAYGFPISITEHWPWAMGCAPLCTDTTVGNPGFWWTVSCSTLPITYITVGCWHLCDPLYTAAGQDLLECIIRRAAPAHTVVNFSYTLTPATWTRGRWNLEAWNGG
jgi:uncharacterized protein YmfQ (DUF2313 family)